MKFNWRAVLLWSNHFYGICAVLLSIESALLLNHTLPSPYFLLLIYLSTIVYYTYAYLQESKTVVFNERAEWYKKRYTYLKIRQIFFTAFCFYIAIVKLNLASIFLIATYFIKLILLFTSFLSLGYYLPNFKIPVLRTYRSKGILKSLAIAWVWTILCYFMPVWLGSENNLIITSSKFYIYFIQFYLFVLVLAILFDIKDINKDQKELVHTIALHLGGEKTVKQIVAPLLILYYLFVIYSVIFLHVHPGFLFLQTLLVILTYVFSLKVLNQKRIDVNILLIDGLLVIKAFIGIAFVMTLNAL